MTNRRPTKQQIALELYDARLQINLLESHLLAAQIKIKQLELLNRLRAELHTAQEPPCMSRPTSSSSSSSSSSVS